MEPEVLIIDDEPKNVFALSAVLRSRNVNMLTARSAMEGLDLLQQHKGIKVVLLDIMMPEIDGYAAMAKIRQLSADLVLIAVTAKAMKGDREKTLEAGADDYIPKPIDVDLLFSKLEKYNVRYNDQ